MKIPALVIVASLLVLTGAAGSAPHPQAAPEVFSRHDYNHDGFIDRREYYRFHQRLREQFARQRRAFRVMPFDELDLDANGLIDRNELINRLPRRRLRKRSAE